MKTKRRKKKAKVEGEQTSPDIYEEELSYFVDTLH